MNKLPCHISSHASRRRKYTPKEDYIYRSHIRGISYIHYRLDPSILISYEKKGKVIIVLAHLYIYQDQTNVDILKSTCVTPASIRTNTITIVRMTSISTISMFAKVSMISGFTFTFHWFIAISIFPMAAWQWQTFCTIFSGPSWVATWYKREIL